ncbi:hypothetical protein FB45DRAFT_169558 [Roridomyces roridus]|uniref:Uncharacterized protein n=1 Tax=Roridomyces roridus TaxID=1738132 RepID=A0AAD7BEF3_9AGAR|nr:hypothetical protein FB45DRAFT_169558 [Roridomyces roridus]
MYSPARIASTIPSMSDSRLYSHLLLPKGHGYPLFHPQPFDDVPLEARRTGTQIGDVGIITSDGAFDVIFNICRAADDPLNRFGVPEGFEQVVLDAGDIAAQEQHHRAGSHVSSTQLSKRRLDVNATVEGNIFIPLGVGAIVEVSTASKQAAVLLLPDGASRINLRRLKRFRDYALKHAQHWYEFVNGDLERMVDSGDLYLVTGCDKSSSWSVAALDNHGEGCGISLKLKACPAGSAAATCTWEWETASSFANSGPRPRVGEETWEAAENQTVFLRGYKVAVRPRSLRKSSISKVRSIVDSKSSDILCKTASSRPSISSTGFGLRSASNFFRRASSGPRDLESLEEISKPFHPGDAINAYLLESCLDALVAVTHDSEWISVVNAVSYFSSYIFLLIPGYVERNDARRRWRVAQQDPGQVQACGFL